MFNIKLKSNLITTFHKMIQIKLKDSEYRILIYGFQNVAMSIYKSFLHTGE